MCTLRSTPITISFLFHINVAVILFLLDTHMKYASTDFHIPGTCHGCSQSRINRNIVISTQHKSRSTTNPCGPPHCSQSGETESTVPVWVPKEQKLSSMGSFSTKIVFPHRIHAYTSYDIHPSQKLCLVRLSVQIFQRKKVTE
jgi:hypothetical protein